MSNKKGLSYFGLTEKNKVKSSNKSSKSGIDYFVSSSSKQTKVPKFKQLEKIAQSPIQTKIIGACSLILLGGGIIHTFIPDPLTKIIIYAVLCFFVLVASYFLTTDNNQVWILLLSVIISFLVWFYFYYKEFTK